MKKTLQWSRDEVCDCLKNNHRGVLVWFFFSSVRPTPTLSLPWQWIQWTQQFYLLALTKIKFQQIVNSSVTFCGNIECFVDSVALYGKVRSLINGRLFYWRVTDIPMLLFIILLNSYWVIRATLKQKHDFRSFIPSLTDVRALDLIRT